MTSDAQPTTVKSPEKPARAGRKTGERRRAQPRVLILPPTLTVQRLAELLDQNPIDVIKQLMRNGIMAAMNQVVDYQVATLVAAGLGIRTAMAETSESSAPIGAGAGKQKDDANLVSRKTISRPQ